MSPPLDGRAQLCCGWRRGPHPAWSPRPTSVMEDSKGSKTHPASYPRQIADESPAVHRASAEQKTATERRPPTVPVPVPVSALAVEIPASRLSGRLCRRRRPGKSGKSPRLGGGPRRRHQTGKPQRLGDGPSPCLPAGTSVKPILTAHVRPVDVRLSASQPLPSRQNRLRRRLRWGRRRVRWGTLVGQRDLRQTRVPAQGQIGSIPILGPSRSVPVAWRTSRRQFLGVGAGVRKWET